MRVPHQAAGATRDGWRGAGCSGVTAADLALATRALDGAAGAIGGLRTIGGGLGFTCNPLFCSCTGDADCNDMFTTSVCGPRAICIDGTCYCIR